MDRIALLFPGQGAQFAGMGKDLYDEHPGVRVLFEEAGDILGQDLKKICFAGNLLTLNRMETMLPAIFTVSVASFRVFRQLLDTPPAVMAGHSLGEYSALVCAEVLSFGDALKIIKKRCELAKNMMTSKQHAMTIVDGIDRFLLEAECSHASRDNEEVMISCYNASEQFVIAGNKEAVMRVEQACIKMDAHTTPMLASAPFHSPCMGPVREEFKTELEKYSYRSPRWPVLSNVSAQSYHDSRSVIENLSAQLTHPVLWTEILAQINRRRVNIAVELGPRSILKNLTRICLPHIRSFAFDQLEERQSLLFLTGINGGPASYNFIEKCLGVTAGTINQNYDPESYDKLVVQPYKKLEQMAVSLEEDKREPTEEELKEAALLTIEILNGKKVPAPERQQSMESLLYQTEKSHLLQSLI